MAEVLRQPIGDDAAKQLVDFYADKIQQQADEAAGADARSAWQKQFEALQTAHAKDMDEQKTMFAQQRSKLKQEAVQKKSKDATAAKLNKLKARQTKINDIQTEVQQQVAAVELAKDKEFLKKLIVQACMMLLEEKVWVQCREEDAGLLDAQLLEEAQTMYADALRQQTDGAVPDAKTTLKLSLITGNGSIPWLSADGLGGVVCLCHKAKITVNNTIEARMNLVLDLDKPAIRKKLFRD